MSKAREPEHLPQGEREDPCTQDTLALVASIKRNCSRIL